MSSRKRAPHLSARDRPGDLVVTAVRELTLGNRLFEALRLNTGMSPRSLALRLGRLVAHGIHEKAPRRVSPGAHEHRLTAKGLDLWPVLVILRSGESAAAARGIAQGHR